MESIQGLNKAEVLAALYNNARVQGMGVFNEERGNMPVNEAEQLLKLTSYFDYVKGRVLKVDLSSDQFDPYLYDRDNGNGAAAKVIGDLKKSKGV